jgi:ribosomal protein S12 methylthiotransferase
MKVFLLNLGCPKNQKDGEVVLASFLKNHFLYTTEINEAEVIIVNTCGFIDEAKKESIAEILNSAEYKNTGKCKALIATGCVSQRYSSELSKELPEVDIFLGVSTYHKAYLAYQEFIKTGSKICWVQTPGYIHDEYDHLDILINSNYVPETHKFSAYVKVSEGCSNSCTYCSIPSIRGTLIYRRLEHVVSEIKFLVGKGVKEIVLIAQDLTADSDYLKKLIRTLSKSKERPEWLRLMYCNPWGVDKDLIDLISKEDWIVKYMDMPIQHISPAILKRMGRKGDSTIIKRNLELLRTAGISVRSTVMLGFPGETDSDFNELRTLVSENWFHWLGLFVYSPQEGTPASSMPKQVSFKVAVERRNELDRLQFDITKTINEGFVGKSFKALVSGTATEEGFLEARMFCQAPVIDGVVLFEGKNVNTPFVELQIEETNGFDLFARFC